MTAFLTCANPARLMIWPTPLRYRLFNSAAASVAILILYGTVAAVALQEPAPVSTRGQMGVEPISSSPPALIPTKVAVPPLRQIVAPRAPVVRILSAFQREQMMSRVQLMKRWEPLIKIAARRFTIPASWIREVMRMESGGRTMIAENLHIVSNQGALGLMQLLPGTYAEMRAQYGLGRDPFEPRDNIFAGAAYLRWLRGRYGFPTMFEAYDDGPGNLEQRLTSGTLLPAETRNYVSVIAAALGGKRPVLAVPIPAVATANGSGTSGNTVVSSNDVASVPRPVDLSTSCAFTRPDGSALVIDCSQVTSVRASTPEDNPSQTQSVITIGSVDQNVRESEEAAKQLVLSHGGHV